MPNGYSLHIGLNHVDPAAYKGWSGQLSGCLNDAASMKAICESQGFSSTSLLDENATAGAVLGGIANLASQAANGDTVVISYSGHGGQVPDTTGTEDDGLCETWVCFDRMVVDKELYALWSNFARNVHIEIYSDSCHSGTVIRALIIPADSKPKASYIAVAAPVGAYATPAGAARGSTRARSKGDAAARIVAPPQVAAIPYNVVRAVVPRAQAAYNAVFAPAVRYNVMRAPKSPFERMIPAPLAFQLFEEQSKLQRQPKPGPIQCGIVFISGCQDNQTSSDGSVNGLFTETLLKVWDNGNFKGSVPQLHHAIVALMPSDQTPNYDLVGLDDDVISNGRPLTILAGSAASINAPVITPTRSSVARSDGPPSFEVMFGAGRNGIVELATDPTCFDDANRRTSDNFYGTWSNSPRLRDGTWSVPSDVWGRMKSASAVYYRAGSTTSTSGWDDYLVSSAGASAPSIAIADGDNANPNSGANDPSIAGPASWPRNSSSPPHFAVSTSATYYIVEVTTDGILFADQNSRTEDNFYATWQDDVGRLTTPEFTLRDDAWARLRGAGRLYYRVGTTTSSDSWDNYKVSTGDGDGAHAPFVRVD